jgi:membrane-bound ClpP family serine protease
MPIKFDCPECSKRLSVPDSFAGKKARCPSCNQTISVPESSKEEAPHYEKGQVIGDKPSLFEALSPVFAGLDKRKIGIGLFSIGLLLMIAAIFAWNVLGVIGAFVVSAGLILLMLFGDKYEKVTAMIIAGFIIIMALTVTIAEFNIKNALK